MDSAAVLHERTSVVLQLGGSEVPNGTTRSGNRNSVQFSSEIRHLFRYGTTVSLCVRRHQPSHQALGGLP
jgi:hypothetical protein